MEVSAEAIFKAVASKMENQCRLPAKHLKSLKSKTLAIGTRSEYFSLIEVECLIRQYYVLLGQGSKIAKPIAGMDKSEFLFILHTVFGIDTKLMIDRIFATLDQNKDGFIGVEEWVEAMAVFLRGSLDEKSKHSFQVYDLNSDQCISKEEMFYLMKNGETTKAKFDQDLEELLDITFQEVDHDHDGFLSYADFQKSVQKNLMYLQAFGKCLPDDFAVTAFENHLSELKRIVKAKGEREMNVPRKDCLLNMSSRNPTHAPQPIRSGKLTGFLPNALRLAHLPPLSPKYRPNGSKTENPGKMSSLAHNSNMEGKEASNFHKSS